MGIIVIIIICCVVYYILKKKRKSRKHRNRSWKLDPILQMDVTLFLCADIINDTDRRDELLEEIRELISLGASPNYTGRHPTDGMVGHPWHSLCMDHYSALAGDAKNVDYSYYSPMKRIGRYCQFTGVRTKEKHEPLYELTKIFIDAGGNINDIDINYAPLDMLKLLLESGYNFNIMKYNSNWVPRTKIIMDYCLHRRRNRKKNLNILLARSLWSNELIKLLIKNGADVNGVERIKDSFGDYIYYGPALYEAVINWKNVDCVKLLVENGADVNKMPGSKSNWSPPLLHAVEQGDKEIVELLLANGANIYAKSFDGNDVFSLTNDISMLKLLHSYE